MSNWCAGEDLASRSDGHEKADLEAQLKLAVDVSFAGDVLCLIERESSFYFNYIHRLFCRQLIFLLPRQYMPRNKFQPLIGMLLF